MVIPFSTFETDIYGYITDIRRYPRYIRRYLL